MVNWLALALALLRAFSVFMTWLQNRELIAEGERRAVAEALRVQADEIHRANEAREDQRQRNAAVPASRSLPDDGFRRD